MEKGKICVITGAAGLIGSEAVKYFYKKFDRILGIDNNSRKEFFGDKGSIETSFSELDNLSDHIDMIAIDIRDRENIERMFYLYSQEHQIDLVIHCAAQPSHDLAAADPYRDFDINAVGTLNLLEATRKYAPNAVFIFTSTNKVYGTNPNQGIGIGIKEEATRYENRDTYGNPDLGISIGSKMNGSIDRTMHSLFGVSKTAADLMVQEYGKYFGMLTCTFRGGCLTGPNHKGAEQHGFLNYLCYCIKNEKPYTIYGYKGKQVRDIIHAYDVVTAMDAYYNKPIPNGVVYNLGGGRRSNCSVIEAIKIIEEKTGKKAITTYDPQERKGDHIWYITNMRGFEMDYPGWKPKYNLHQIIDEIITAV